MAKVRESAQESEEGEGEKEQMAKGRVQREGRLGLGVGNYWNRRQGD